MPFTLKKYDCHGKELGQKNQMIQLNVFFRAIRENH